MQVWVEGQSCNNTIRINWKLKIMSLKILPWKYSLNKIYLLLGISGRLSSSKRDAHLLISSKFARRNSISSSTMWRSWMRMKNKTKICPNAPNFIIICLSMGWSETKRPCIIASGSIVVWQMPKSQIMFL